MAQMLGNLFKTVQQIRLLQSQTRPVYSNVYVLFPMNPHK